MSPYIPVELRTPFYVRQIDSDYGEYFDESYILRVTYGPHASAGTEEFEADWAEACDQAMTADHEGGDPYSITGIETRMRARGWDWTDVSELPYITVEF